MWRSLLPHVAFPKLLHWFPLNCWVEELHSDLSVQFSSYLTQKWKGIVFSEQLHIFQIAGRHSISYGNKDIQIPSKHNKIYYILPLLDYMFRLLSVIIRPSSELIQNYLIPSALWDR